MRRGASAAARAPRLRPHLLFSLALFALIPRALTTPPLPLARQASAPRLPPSINLNSGGPPIGRFQADDPWVVGSTSKFDLPTAAIGGAEDKNLPMYRSHRYGTDDDAVWGYDLPVEQPGLYDCTAHFAETDDGSKAEGKRIFSLAFASAAERPSVFRNIDVFAQRSAFTVYTATVERFPVPGVLALRLYPVVGNAFLSGLTCERAADLPDGIAEDYEAAPRLPAADAAAAPMDPSLTPVPLPAAAPPSAPVSSLAVLNINCGGGALGRFIPEDYDWIVGGPTSFWEGPSNIVIGGVAEEDEPVIRSHRYGENGKPFGYRIPPPQPGVYDCTLHFAETDSESFKVGARVFDVDVMGTTINDLDVFKETGEAEFTQLVRTFPGLELSSELSIDLTPSVGDAFLSAITCTQTAELPGTTQVTLPVPSAAAAVAADAEADAPSSAPDSPVTPEPSLTPDVPTASPSLSPDDATPSPGMNDADSSPVPSEGAEAEEPGESAEPTVGEEEEEDTAPSAEPSVPADTEPSPLASPEPLASIEAKKVPGPGQAEHTYKLRVAVSGSGPQVFTNEMRGALKKVLSSATPNLSTLWAMTGIKEADTPLSRWSVRQAGSTPPPISQQYDMDMQSILPEGDLTEGVAKVNTFIENGTATSKMQELNFNNVDIRLQRAPSGTATTQEESGGRDAGATAGIVIGTGLAVLALIAVAVFLYVSYWRKDGDEHDGGFDGPPPDLSGSENSELARSETGGSVEFLDDDSTFTAATSRAGEHVDQVEFVKDAFGRGTTAGTHGV